VSHARSGLPPLNLEPFDPTPLYAAARSPRRDKHQPNHKEKRNPLFTGVVATLLIALAAGAAFFLV
jgi:hypothetical protein